MDINNLYTNIIYILHVCIWLCPRRVIFWNTFSTQLNEIMKYIAKKQGIKNIKIKRFITVCANTLWISGLKFAKFRTMSHIRYDNKQLFQNLK